MYEANFLTAIDGLLHCRVCRQLLLRVLWLHRTICFRAGWSTKERAIFFQKQLLISSCTIFVCHI